MQRSAVVFTIKLILSGSKSFAVGNTEEGTEQISKDRAGNAARSLSSVLSLHNRLTHRYHTANAAGMAFITASSSRAK